MAKERKIGRQKAVSDLKRELILDAARKVFEADGLDGASLRAIAAGAGYTPAALYFHFESKEAIYAEVLRCSLTNLGQATSRAVSRAKTAADRLRAAATAFFRGAGIGHATDRRRRASARRPARGSQIVDGGYFRSCRRASAIGTHWPYPHVWGFGAAPHGTLHRGQDHGAHRRAAEVKPLNPNSRGPTLLAEPLTLRLIMR